MPHGTPDWGLVGPKATTFGLDDLGEHAARLGSIVTFDRRGDVMFLDDFEAGLGKAIFTLNGLNAAAQLHTERPKSGAFCLRMVGGSDALRYCLLSYWLGYPVLGSFGFEASVAFPGELESLWIRMLLYTGTRELTATIIYDRATLEWRYTPRVGADIPFATNWQLLFHYPPYHTIKLVIDGAKETYLRAMIDDRWYLGAQPLIPVTTLGLIPHLECEIWLVSRALNNDYVTVDDIIITQNEP